MKEINLPQILNQHNVPACAAFAVAGLANYQLQQKGVDDTIDPLVLYNSCERGGMGTNVTRVLDYGKTMGFSSNKGKKYKVREWQFIASAISEIEKQLDQHGGLIMNYALHDKDPIANRLDSGFVLSREPWDTHAMVICGYDRLIKRFKVANSWGGNWGKDGYFFIPYVLMRPEYVKQLFWFSLS